MTQQLNNEIVIFGKTRSSSDWGHDFLPELRRILTQYVKPVTRAYLEWGAGNSTLAIIDWHDILSIDRFYSIDNDQKYLAELLLQLPRWNGFQAVYAHLTGPMANDRDEEYAYSTIPLTFGTQFDFIFIDGRRRLECAFVASLLCHRDTIVVLHDFRRTRYQPVTSV